MSAAHYDWYLKEWMEHLRVNQAALMKETDYPKAKMSDLYNGKQRFNRDILNEIAHALHIRPWELLMHPHDAMAIRRVRESAATIATVKLTDDPEDSRRAVNE